MQNSNGFEAAFVGLNEFSEPRYRPIELRRPTRMEKIRTWCGCHGRLHCPEHNRTFTVPPRLEAEHERAPRRRYPRRNLC